MYHLAIATLALTLVIDFLFGLVVLLRVYQKAFGWYFVITVFGLVLWVIGDAGLLLSRSDGMAHAFARLFYVAPMITPISIWMFALSFPDNKPLPKPAVALGLLTCVGLGFLFFGHFGFFVHDVAITNTLNVATPAKPGFYIYSAYFSIFFTLAYIAFWQKLRHLKGTARSQVWYTFFGVLAGSVLALISNLTLPTLGIRTYIWLGPFFTLLFPATVVIAIVRHHLFDIRLVVARSLGYVATLVAVAILYGLIVFGFAGEVLQLHFSVAVQVLLSAATGLMALSFSRIKRLFDRLSNRLFYRDAYDAQDLYDRLNHILVSTLDTNKLLRDTSKLLQDSFRADFVVIGLKETEMRQRLIVGALPGQSFDDAIPIVRRLTIKEHRRVIATDYLEGNELQLKQILEQHNIAILVRLAPNVRSNEEGLGYIAFGRKKSGGPYVAGDFRVLDTVANELIVAIQNALNFEEIQNFNKTLQERVRRATMELRHTNARLKALDETKDEFISMASHQLRTPLTSVKGYLSMVLEGDAGKLNANQHKLLEQSFASSQRMVFLISDLLNLSRLNSGKFVIESSPVDLNEIIQLEVDQLRENAKSRDLTLIYNPPKHFPILMLDETKIHQVVMNFLDNAIYYTPSGGTVTVNLVETPTAVEYTVVDTGIGVPKAVQHKLFSKFYRASNAQQARPDGTGLGLFMAKKVIVAQGGSIIFQSVEGKGSTFGFRFNKAKLLPPQSSSVVVAPAPVAAAHSSAK